MFINQENRFNLFDHFIVYFGLFIAGTLNAGLISIIVYSIFFQ